MTGIKLNLKSNALLVFILTAGVFGIINTEMGVIGILPLIAKTFNVTIPEAGWTVSIFALVVAASAPIMPLLFSGFNRKKVMLLAMGLFTLSNIISMLTTNFTVLLIARALPAFLHPVYVLLVATVLFVPSLPVREKLSYGMQLGVLKKSITWYSIAGITLINGALFGFFSYMSDFLQQVTEVSYSIISTLLLVYGLANIIGNMIAGRLLAQNPICSMVLLPFALLGSYICLFFLGKWLVAIAVIILLLGILAGCGQNTMQYMITHAASEAPDFANALYLLSANLGTMMGATVCGAFITAFDTRYSVFGSLLFLVVGIGFVILRIRTRESKHQIEIAIAA